MSDCTPERRTRLLTADELAERWQVARSTIYHLARTRQIPVVNIGRYYRFKTEEIEAFEDAGGTGFKDE